MALTIHSHATSPVIVTLFDDLAVLPVSLDDLFKIDGFPVFQFQGQHCIIETSVPRNGHGTDGVADKRRYSNRFSEFVEPLNGGLFAHDGRLIAFLRDDCPFFRMPSISCNVSLTCLLISITPFMLCGGK